MTLKRILQFATIFLRASVCRAGAFFSHASNLHRSNDETKPVPQGWTQSTPFTNSHRDHMCTDHTCGHPLLITDDADQKILNVLLLTKGALRLKEQKDENLSRFPFAGEKFPLPFFFPFLSSPSYFSHFPLSLSSFFLFSPFSCLFLSQPLHPFSFSSLSHFIRLARRATLQKLLSRAGLLSLALKLPPEPTGYSFRCLTSVEHN